jgi:transcriptional regulator with XRE-family HTH domain
MALFFDGAWFDERLASLGLLHATLAAALGLSEQELSEVWKDQRELSARDVAMLANLLGASAEDVALHAGVSTPVPRAVSSDPALKAIEERLARIEAMLEELLRTKR